jgi:hypothetical protein
LTLTSTSPGRPGLTEHAQVLQRIGCAGHVGVGEPAARTHGVDLADGGQEACEPLALLAPSTRPPMSTNCARRHHIAASRHRGRADRGRHLGHPHVGSRVAKA